MKHNKRNPKPRLLALAVSVGLLTGAVPAMAQDDVPSLEEMWKIIQQQQGELNALREENERLRKDLETPIPPGAIIEADEVVVVNETIIEEVVEEGPDNGGTTMEIYGHAMLDMGYRTNQVDPDWYDVMRPTKLPSFEDQYGADGDFSASVRQSRLGFTTSTPTSYGDLKTIFEFELFGVGSDAGQTTFRLRHAWGEMGQFGAGQYWSTFMDINVFPNSIEYWGPNGMVFYRNIQARWTPWKTDAGSSFAVSLEQPGGSGDGGRFADRVELEGVESNFKVPDLAAHYKHAGDWGHVQLAGILRKIEWVDTNQDQFDLSGDALGWGLNLSTNVNIGRHVFRGSVVYGEGIQNYMNDASIDVGVVADFDNPVSPIYGEAIPLLGVVAFLDLNWSERWTSTMGYSMQDNDLTNGQLPSDFEKGQYALANILWHPHPNVMMGPEIQWIKRDNFYDGFSADDLRIQFSAKYNFSYALGGR